MFEAIAPFTELAAPASIATTSVSMRPSDTMAAASPPRWVDMVV